MLAKVLALRLNKVNTSVVHPDQAGYMPQKYTEVNLHDYSSTCNYKLIIWVLGLDATKTFDSIGWDYLWWVLKHFGFGEKLITWVKHLYHTPCVIIHQGK